MGTGYYPEKLPPPDLTFRQGQQQVEVYLTTINSQEVVFTFSKPLSRYDLRLPAVQFAEEKEEAVRLAGKLLFPARKTWEPKWPEVKKTAGNAVRFLLKAEEDREPYKQRYEQIVAQLQEEGLALYPVFSKPFEEEYPKVQQGLVRERELLMQALLPQLQALDLKAEWVIASFLASLRYHPKGPEVYEVPSLQNGTWVG